MTQLSSDETDESGSPCCRICQSTELECPDLPLIRPCNCRGSLAFVHVECLNQWRATSATALTTCSVCGFTYKTKPKPAYSALVSNHNFILAVSCLIALVATLVTGALLFSMPTARSHKGGFRYELPKLFRFYMGIRAWPSCDTLFHHNLQRFVDPVALSIESFTLHFFKYWYGTICTRTNRALMDILLVGHVAVSSVTSLCVTVPKLWAARREHMDQNQLISVFLILATFSQSSEYSLTALCWHGMATFVKLTYGAIESEVRRHLSGLEEIIGQHSIAT